uniref:Lines homolog 1 n=1 Tax=Jaculus jaculus TaxID=51337 RepID=A0A8C5NZU0_JACJA
VNMEAFYHVLDQFYKKVLLGVTLENDSQDYILYLNPDLSEQAFPTDLSFESSDATSMFEGVQSQHGPSSGMVTAFPDTQGCVKKHSQRSSAKEVTLLQLTVIRVMITKGLSSETEAHAKEKYRHIMKILLQSAEIDSKLICLFQNADKLLSHMAAKCLALLLYFQLREKVSNQITLLLFGSCNSWIAFCQKHLSDNSESDEAIHCLWIVSAVMKEILKDACSQTPELVRQLVTPLDTTFEAFCNFLFSQQFEACRDLSKRINSVMCYLELLELLIASRICLKLCFRSQRILFLKPFILDFLTWPMQAFVKRKLIMFLKKCLLCKVGEDLCRGCVLASVSPDPLLDGDMLALANAVLHAVQLGLLGSFSVHRKPSYFGGDEVCQPGYRPNSGPDHVILRAASLVTVKSLEISFQNCISANEMKVNLKKFMSEVLAFLKPQLQPTLQGHNPCEWLSRVFIEQDDDMLEAANACLSIYLKLTRECEATGNLTKEKETWICHTHENGYNPHCIFLFFLKNVAFDSTVLLDFLISSETCFLEYFVRYLKFLQKDWDHFFTICKFFDVAESQHGVSVCGRDSSVVQDWTTNQTAPERLTAAGCHRSAGVPVAWTSHDPSEALNQVVMSRETHTVRNVSLPSLQALQSLVDYESSEESESEPMDQCLANCPPTSLHQEATEEMQNPPGTSRAKEELSQEPLPRPLDPKASNTLSVDCGAISEVGICDKTVKCFQELHSAIYRLQKRNLFPYNPAALLKLLKQVEAINNKV